MAILVATLGGDLGGDLGGGPAEMPAGEAGAEPEAGAAEEESSLLAVPPGSRNAPRITPGSRGKAYRPVKHDGRKGAAVKAHNNAKWSKQLAGSSLRNTVPGMRDIQTLSRGIYEQEASIYSLREQTEEDKLFRINKSIKVLLEDLERKDNLPVEHKNEDKAQ